MDWKSLLKFGFIILLLVSSTVFSMGSIENSHEDDFSDLKYCDKEFYHENDIELHLCDRCQTEQKSSHYKEDVLNRRSREKVEHQSDDDNYTPRDPIYINGNDDFHEKAEDNNWFGDGTEQDPYIIEGYEIDGSEPTYAIIIGHTDVHFEIRNNFLYDAWFPEPYWYTGAVTLVNVTNGMVKRNTIRFSSYGVNLGGSYNEISNNTLINNDGGIVLRDSHNNTVDGNNITTQENSPVVPHTGIHIRDSEDNIIYNNNISNHSRPAARAIFANNDSKNNLIYHNIFIDNEVHAVDHGDNTWNKSYPIGGNYWDNHTKPDEYGGPDQDEAGSDGFMDEPKVIDGRGDNMDYYPLNTTSPPTFEEGDGDTSYFNLDILLFAVVSIIVLIALFITVMIYRKKKHS